MYTGNNSANSDAAINENGPLPGLDAFKTKKLSPAIFVTLCVIAGICAASIPAAILEAFPALSASPISMPAVTFVALITSAVFIVFFARQLPLVIASIAIYVIGMSFLGSDALPILLISFMCTSAVYSFLVTMASKRTLWVLIALPVISYAAALAITQAPLWALASLSPYLPALIMGILTRYKASSATVHICAVATVIVPAAIAIIVVLAVTGLDLRELSDSIRPQIVTFINDQILEYYNEFVKALDELAAESNTSADALYDTAKMKLLIDEVISSTEYMVTGMFNIILGLSVCLTYIIFHMIRSSQISLLILYKGHKYLTPKALVVSMGPVSAIAFILACVFAVSTDTTGVPDMVSAVGTNLALMLLPAMMLSGYYTVIELVARAVQSRKFFLVALIAITVLVLTFMLFYYVLLILALIGAGFEIAKAASIWAKNKSGKGEN